MRGARRAVVAWCCAALTLSFLSSTAAAGSGRVEVLLQRAQWLVEHGQSQRAVGLLRRAMQAAPESPTPVARFAELVLPDVSDARAWTPDAGLIAEANTVLDAIEHVAQRDDTGVGDRAESLYAQRIWALALAQSHTVAIEAWLGREVRLSRDHAELGRKLAALAIRRGDLEAARRALVACVGFNGEDSSLRSDLAAVELARGNGREALVLFRDVAVAQPGDLNAQRDLAGALLTEGDAITAMGLLRATAGCNALCDCALELTRAALAAQDADVAVEAAGHALRACTIDDPEPALWLATAEHLAGHTSQAMTAYRLALQRDPHSQRAQEALRALGANGGTSGSPSAPRGN